MRQTNQHDPRASCFCAWLGQRLEMTKSCSSGAGGAVLIIGAALGVIGVCLGGLTAGQSNHQDPRSPRSMSPKRLIQNQTVFLTIILWGENIRRAGTMSIWPRFANAEYLYSAEAAGNILRDDQCSRCGFFQRAMEQLIDRLVGIPHLRRSKARTDNAIASKPGLILKPGTQHDGAEKQRYMRNKLPNAL